MNKINLIKLIEKNLTDNCYFTIVENESYNAIVAVT